MNRSRLRLVAVLLLLSLCLTACGSEPTPTPEPTATAKTGDEIISKGVGFVITLGKSSDDTPRYDYTVTATDGSVIESASCAMQPKVAPLGKELLGFRFYTEDKTWCRYYDLAKGVASPSYFGAFWDNGRLVAHNDHEKSGALVVCDIFDPAGFRYQAPLPEGATEVTVIAAVPSEDGSVLNVEYLTDLSDSRVTVTLPLSN